MCTVLKEHMDITEWEGGEERRSLDMRLENRIKTTGKDPSLIKACKRAPLLPSFCLKGSMALEGCLVLPLFLFFMATLLYGIEMVRFQSDVYEAVHQTGSAICFYAYTEEYGKTGSGNDTGMAQEEIKRRLGEQNLPFLCVEGGEGGMRIDTREAGEGNLEIRIAYRMKPFIWRLPVGNITINDRYYGHGFVGYTGGDGPGSWKEEAYVYITPFGTRYHLTEGCRYLRVQIQAVMGEELSEIRNGSGGKYYPCGECGPDGKGLVYLTEWGDRYHGRSDCPSIKRTVYIVTLSEAEAEGRSVCRSCG